MSGSNIRSPSNMQGYDTRNSLFGFGIVGMGVSAIPLMNTTGLWREQCKEDTDWTEKKKGPHPVLYCKD